MKRMLLVMLSMMLLTACSSMQRAPSSEACKNADEVASKDCQDDTWRRDLMMNRR